MKAIRLEKHGPPSALKYVETPEPEPGPGEVLVRVRAALEAASVDGARAAMTATQALPMDTGPSIYHAVWVTHAGVIRAVHYLREHGMSSPSSTRWPQSAPTFGAWTTLDLPLLV